MRFRTRAPGVRPNPALARSLTLALTLGVSAMAGAQNAVVELEPGEGSQLVAAHCGACHSLRLVTQNRGDEAHWKKLIRWMQAEHNLWDLGSAEEDILAYLATHFGVPDQVPRRAPLIVQWRSENAAARP